MNKKLLTTALIVVVVVALGAFAYSIKPAPSVTKQDAKPEVAKQEVPKFNLSVNSWVGFAPFYLAQEKGIFKEEGVDVNIVLMDDTAQRKAALLKGDVDGLADSVDLLVMERDEKVPAVAVMLNDLSNGADGILVDESIKTVKDLKGKKIAVQKNFVSESFLNYVLEKNGLTSKDATTVDTEAGAAGAAFVAGKVDVAVTFEPWLSKAKERKGGKILVTSADVPGVVVDILSMNENYLKKNPETTKKVMRAWFKALDLWKANPTEANAIMAKHYKITAPEFADMISGLKWPSIEENTAYFGKESGQGEIFKVAKTFSDIFIRDSVTKTQPDLSVAINQTLINSLK